MLAAQEPTLAAGPDPASRSPDWPGGPQSPVCKVGWRSRSHEQHVAKLGTEGLFTAQHLLCCCGHPSTRGLGCPGG